MQKERWRLHELSAWPDHADGWRRLNKAMMDSPLLDPEFIEPFFAELIDAPLKLAVCSDNDGPAAMTLVCDDGRGRASTFSPRQAPLGFWVQRPDLSMVKLGLGLFKVLPLTSLQFTLMTQDPDIFPRPDNSGHVKTIDHVPTARIPLAGSFEDYWAARSKKLRENLRRARNGLERNNRPPRLIELTKPEDMARGIAEYGEMESAGWKGGIDGAIHADNAQGRYYTEMLTRFARMGSASIFQFYYGDKLVASDICVYRNGVIIGLKTTYDETEKSTSPALMMRQEMMRDFLDHARFTRYEFYGRVRDWQTKWSNDFRVMYHLNLYRWSWLGALHSRLSKSGKAEIGGSARAEESGKGDK